MEIPVLSSGFAGQHAGLYAECEAGWQGSTFFCKALGAKHTQTPQVIAVDKNAAYPVAVDELKQDKTLKAETQLRQSKYLNSIIEQDHRNIKRIVKLMMEFQSFNSARRTLRGIEAMSMIRNSFVTLKSLRHNRLLLFSQFPAFRPLSGWNVLFYSQQFT